MGKLNLKKIAKNVVSHPQNIVFGPTGVKGLSDLSKTEANRRKGQAQSEEQRKADIARGEQDLIQQQGETERQARLALGEQLRGKILDYGKEFSGTAAARRGELAQMLASSNAGILDRYSKNVHDVGQQAFEQATPGILQDLNSRGLFTSPSEVNNAQSRALKELATQEQSQVGELTANLGMDTQNQLLGFDTNTYNDLNGITSDALNAALEGDSAAVDATLGAGRNSLQRTLDLHDQDREERLAGVLAKRQNRNQLVSSLISAGGMVGGAYLGGPLGATLGSKAGDIASNSFGFSSTPQGYQNPGGTLNPGPLSLGYSTSPYSRGGRYGY